MEMREELKKRTGEVEAVVESYLPKEEGHQKTIFEAMNYSVKLVASVCVLCLCRRSADYLQEKYSL